MSHDKTPMPEHLCACCGPRIDRRLDEITQSLRAVCKVLHCMFHKLEGLKTQGENLMNTIEEAVAKIDEALNKQAVSLQAIADAEQETSNDINDLIAHLGEQVPPETVEKLKSVAARAQAASDALDLQAAFSKATAAKWTPGADPVPVPPPSFTPPPK